MNYLQTVNYLFEQLPMFSRIGSAAYKKDLTNITRLCQALDHPEKKIRTIHVGGTNGKGSVSHMLASILQAAGYKTGLYTSPHLFDFRERIKINGQLAEEDFVVSFVEKHRALIEEIQPSFFEITAAMAFDYFARNEVDVAVIEVGLGGRLDSTNIITPVLSVITNIGWDHANMLGDTLVKIAGEKAGIIKPGIPVIIGERQKETEAVFEQKAAAENAPIRFASDQYKTLHHSWHNGQLHLEIECHGKEIKEVITDLPGIYQTKNVVTALAAASKLKQLGWKLEDEHARKGLKHARKNTGLSGRWEIISKNPAVVLEVAHNREGMLQMKEQLKETDFENLHIVLGMVKDKDIAAVLEVLPKKAHYYFTAAAIPRALPAVELKNKAAAFGLQGEIFNDVNEALSSAKQVAGRNDLVIVCGSIFLVADLIS